MKEFKTTASHIAHLLVWSVAVVIIFLASKGTWMVRYLTGWACAI